MNPIAALNVLSAMTEPQAAGRATREDFYNAQVAILTLRDFLQSLQTSPVTTGQVNVPEVEATPKSN